MSLSAGFVLVHCPECDTRLQHCEMHFSGPDHWAMKCPKCGAIVEIKRGKDGHLYKETIKPS